MALVVSNTDKDFEIAPEGSFPAVCYMIVDLGTQHNQAFDIYQRKVLIGFELIDENMKDGRPFVISGKYTFSLSKKSTLRKLLESWRNKAFTEDELKGFDLSKLLDKACMINVVHKQVEDKTYANISAIMSLPKGMQISSPKNPTIIYEMGNQEVYEKLPEWIQKQIMKSEEMNEGKREAEPLPENTEGEDNIPF